MDLYFERHDGQAVTIEDFVKCFEDASGRDLTQFSLWYHQAGTPLVTASGAYDAAAKTFTLSLEQMVPATPGRRPGNRCIFRCARRFRRGRRIALTPTSVTGAELTDDVLHLTARTQTAVFHGIRLRDRYCR